MKKLLLCFLVSASLIACTNQETKTNKATNSYPANAVGYNLDSSENIVTTKRAIEAGLISDTATAKFCYEDTATVYDNQNKQTIAESMQVANTFKAKGVTFKLEKINAIWENVLNIEDDLGVKNYVSVYFTASIYKADKKVVIGFNAIFAFKNGKIIREWDTYDTAPILELLK